MPVGGNGSTVVYRKSWVNEAGFDTVPERLPRLPRAVPRRSEANGHPSGFALGNAVGDAAAGRHWVLWGFGGSMIDENDQVVIDSPETIEALEYAKELYATFIPGTLSWLDPQQQQGVPRRRDSA